MWWIFLRDFYRVGQVPMARTVFAPAPAAPAPAAAAAAPEPARSRSLSVEDNAREGRNFLSSMSHELRTPLNAIMGFSDMMRQQVYGELGHPHYREYAEHIHEAGERLLAKVNGILEAAALESGSQPTHETVVELPELLTDLGDRYTHAAACRGVTVRVDAPTRILLHADRRQIATALAHMLENAVSHSLAEGEIHLTLRPQGHEGVVVAVRDYGKGMPEAQLQDIRRALASDASYFNIAGNSIGMGLALAREFAARHEGSIAIESVRGQGTVVSMFLPAARILSGLPTRKPRLQIVQS